MATLHPDIIIRYYIRHRVIIINITIPFENRMLVFNEARQRKTEKYHPSVERLNIKGYSVDIDAFAVGSLGGWD